MRHGPLLAVIPARAGSRRLTGKSRRRLGGSSMVELAIDQARASGVCDEIAVSTDDDVIVRQALRAGARVISRPARLATASAATMAVARHALDALERETGTVFGGIVILQPTSPLRTGSDIRRAVAIHRRRGRSVLSVSVVKHWTWGMRMDASGRLSRIVWAAKRPRTEDRPVYLPNGAIYVIDRERVGDRWADRLVGYVMPQDRSIDIDDATDLAIARALLACRER